MIKINRTIYVLIYTATAKFKGFIAAYPSIPNGLILIVNNN